MINLIFCGEFHISYQCLKKYSRIFHHVLLKYKILLNNSNIVIRLQSEFLGSPLGVDSFVDPY